MPHSNAVGRLGEDVACRYFSQNGYEVLEKNLQLSHLEIDLLALKDRCLYYIEVKASRVDLDMAIAQCTAEKLHRMKRAALAHWTTFEGHWRCDRFSIGLFCVAIDEERKKVRYQWIEDVLE